MKEYRGIMMLVLNKKSLNPAEEWHKAGIKLPYFDYDALCESTYLHPRWVHVGPGNIFRGYIATLAQKLIEQEYIQQGITVLSTFDHGILDSIYEPHDALALQVVMHANGQLDKTVIASIGEYLRADSQAPEQWQRAKQIFMKPELQMVSFTITEKGYHIRDINGRLYSQVQDDMEKGPHSPPANGMAIITALLYARYRAGQLPIALLSMDNFSHNGDKLADSICAIARAWCENKTADNDFLAYLQDTKKVAFPCSMIDKITPRPDQSIARLLEQSGFSSTALTVTDKNTYISPFVNTEAFQCLVVEDTFPNGRPPLEKAGVYMTDRRTVDLSERMKVCTCLNPLHTALAIFGCLLGYSSISGEMNDPDLKSLVHGIGYREGMPVVADPGLLSPQKFLKEVLEERFPNPFIPDTPQRIVTDTSQKLAIRFGETIKLYISREDLDVRSLHLIPLTLAAWCRYLLGIDDNGSPMKLSPDPLLEELRALLADVQFGAPGGFEGLRPILSNAYIFGCDLYEVGLGNRIEEYFSRMLTGIGAVRKTLHEEVSI